jgi:uncharacterized protein (DUF1800 family)
MDPVSRPTRSTPWRLAAAFSMVAALAACGGGGGGGSAPPAAGSPPPTSGSPPPPASAALSERSAVRLATQASFGANDALVAEIRQQGAAPWVAGQIALRESRYTSGRGDEIDKNTSDTPFCDQPKYEGETCWRDWASSQPLLWDFYRNAVDGRDQLRQRVAFALQQIVVVNDMEVSGTYGFRYHFNTLLDNALGNYRDVLKKTALSPVMGSFLDNANNDKAAPNENFARELLQLFAIGTCKLNRDGALTGGRCQPTYDNQTVREYAYALTGWTYPAGGATPWGCWPQGANCPYYGGDMLPLPTYHDSARRTLLGGVVVPAGSTPEAALDKVLDSLMAHPNIAPFVGRQLIRHLVTSNPSPAYVQRVANAFMLGVHSKDGQRFGAGRAGDLAATVAAVLLDDEARNDSPPAEFGRLREPVQMFTSVLRALNGRTDGDALAWWWGGALRQHVFRPPSVFNFYAPDYPLPGREGMVGPAFGIHNADAALERLNFLTYVLMWDGSEPSKDVPAAIGTRVDLKAFDADVDDPARLVDRLSMLAMGNKLPANARSAVIQAVESFNAKSSDKWRAERVKQAAYLVFAAPQFQVQR